MAGEQESVKSRYTVTEDDAGQRLDVFLKARNESVSRAKIQKLIERSAVSVNGRPARSRDAVAAGDLVELAWLEQEPTGLVPVEMKLQILFEDEDVIVVDKPAGISVHPGAGGEGPTLVQGLLHHAKTLGQPERAKKDATTWARPGIVHRLDKDTSGVLVVAKTDKAHAALAKQFLDKTTLVREYVALLDGAMTQAEILHDSYLYRDPVSRLKFASMSVAEMKKQKAKTGEIPKSHRYAKSRFVRQAVFGERLTLARVRLYTGRTHQIRVHAKDLKLPVVGDPVYHKVTQLPKSFPKEIQAAISAISRQLLHAEVLSFSHPTSGETCRFEAPLPRDFSHLLKLLEPFGQAAPKRNDD